MKKLILLFGSITFWYSSMAQSVNNTTDGSVNILAPHSIVGVSTNESLITASYYWYGDSSIFCKNVKRPYAGLKPIFGTQLQAKNESGIAGIFNKGDYAPTGKIGFTAGATFNNYQKILDSINLKKVDEIQIQKKVLRDEYKKNVIKVIDTFFSTNKGKIDSDKISAFKKSLDEQLADFDTKAKNHLLGEKQDEDLKAEVNKLVIQLSALESDYKTNDEALSNKDVVFEKTYHRFAFFGNFSMQALTFKQYEARDTLVLSNNFTDKTFYGADLRFGINYNIDVRWMFGVTSGIRHWNTFEALTDKEYNLSTSTVSGNTTLKTEKKLTGYSGDYGEFNQFLLNLDVVYFLYDTKQQVQSKLKQINNEANEISNAEVRNIFAINPYFSLKNSLNKTVFPNVMTAGLNVFTFKPDGKYNVGFFVELYDIENNVAKMDPEAKLRQGYQRLSFGIVTKLALSSMFSPAF